MTTSPAPAPATSRAAATAPSRAARSATSPAAASATSRAAALVATSRVVALVATSREAGSAPSRGARVHAVHEMIDEQHVPAERRMGGSDRRLDVQREK